MLFAAFNSSALYSQDSRKVPSAEEFLVMSLDKAFPIIAQLKKEEAKELITQIRAKARETNPDIDKLYFLISHLEEIQAVEKEQARLVSLIWVYVLGFALFSGFLFYTTISQRKAIRELQRNIK
ncbi:MAG: hypothetical protein JJT78_14760 [Leptospira sp.]|nr:hypothetical protein [Leptospira sp.]